MIIGGGYNKHIHRCSVTHSVMSHFLWPYALESPPGSSVHGILQARIPEWAAMPSSRGSSWSRDRTHLSYLHSHWQVGSLPLVPPGKLLRLWSSLLSLLPQKLAVWWRARTLPGIREGVLVESNSLLGKKKQPPEFSSTSFFKNVFLKSEKQALKV